MPITISDEVHQGLAVELKDNKITYHAASEARKYPVGDSATVERMFKIVSVKNKKLVA
ncbi:hypothetical protein HDU79_003491 [Rhizoclosmatium sp. JEL0117]|nr:hypothetical protein HDU79_003491 [Rhizoclosmatium sp. JEL0117]